MYPSVFNHFWHIAVYRWRVTGFQNVVKKRSFRSFAHEYTRERMSVFNHILLSPGYTPGTIAVNVTWIEREFNACQTHRSMYTSIFNRLRARSDILVGNRNFFLPPLHLTPPYGVAPETIAVNVTRLERGFNADQTHRSIYPSIFNRLRAIARYWSEIATFSYPLAHLTPPYGVAPETIAVNFTWIERELNAC